MAGARAFDNRVEMARRAGLEPERDRSAACRLEQDYEIGERVEVEIDFLTQPESKTVVSGVGYVVRETSRRDRYRAAIHFDLGCSAEADRRSAYRASRARRASLNDFTPSAM